VCAKTSEDELPLDCNAAVTNGVDAKHGAGSSNSPCRSAPSPNRLRFRGEATASSHGLASAHQKPLREAHRAQVDSDAVVTQRRRCNAYRWPLENRLQERTEPQPIATVWRRNCVVAMRGAGSLNSPLQDRIKPKSNGELA
jgi:hypothetical protein